MLAVEDLAFGRRVGGQGQLLEDAAAAVLHHHDGERPLREARGREPGRCASQTDTAGCISTDAPLPESSSPMTPCALEPSTTQSGHSSVIRAEACASARPAASGSPGALTSTTASVAGAASPSRAERTASGTEVSRP